MNGTAYGEIIANFIAEQQTGDEQPDDEADEMDESEESDEADETDGDEPYIVECDLLRQEDVEDNSDVEDEAEEERELSPDEVEDRVKELRAHEAEREQERARTRTQDANIELMFRLERALSYEANRRRSQGLDTTANDAMANLRQKANAILEEEVQRIRCRQSELNNMDDSTFRQALKLALPDDYDHDDLEVVRMAWEREREAGYPGI